jgi:hypothetical protein
LKGIAGIPPAISAKREKHEKRDTMDARGAHGASTIPKYQWITNHYVRVVMAV